MNIQAAHSSPLRCHRHEGPIRRVHGGRLGVLTLLLLVLTAMGCATQQIRFRKEAFSPVKLLSMAARSPEKELSRRTRLTLRSFDLERSLDKDSRKTLREMQQHVNREPTLDLTFAVAELALLEARRHELLDPDSAMQYYLVSAMHAFGYLFDPRFQNRRNSYDPHFREACLFYNDSFERILRLLGNKRSVDLPPGRLFTIDRRQDGPFHLSCAHLSGQWNGDDLEPFQFATDYEIKGLQNEFRQYGLGVPLLAKRKSKAQTDETMRYTPPSLCFPVTAILRFLPGDSLTRDGRSVQAMIELYDPLSFLSTNIMNHQVPLESDLTTPIAYSISDPRIAKIDTFGLVRSDLLSKSVAEVFGSGETDDDDSENGFQNRSIQGLYMMQPHEAGKIPVIFVHGLWSSPMAWMEMFNALRGEPELRARFQFYFYFYPTGQPFWVSAAQLRRDLAEFRASFDPTGSDPVFDEMVLIGHSMGGLISHLQTLDSGNEFWKLVSEESPELVLKNESDRDRAEILSWFFFQANPSIKRVVSIATPHRGSEMSNNLTQWFGRKVIKLPENVRNAVESLTESRDLLKENSILKVDTSVESLGPKQSVFEVMERRRRHARTFYHNIVGDLERDGPISRHLAPSDGVVKTSSSRLEGCVSEITVQCEHSSIHSHPKTIVEVRRILFEHLHY